MAPNAHPGVGPGLSDLAHLLSRAPLGAGRPAPTPCISPHLHLCLPREERSDEPPLAFPTALRGAAAWPGGRLPGLLSAPAPLTGAMDPG